jgi:hypothetical protein
MLEHTQLLIVIFGTFIVVVVLTIIGYCACYKQREVHEPRSGREDNPLLNEDGHSPRSPHLPAASIPQKGWSNTYGELGRSQVTAIIKWIDEVRLANPGVFEDIEEVDCYVHTPQLSIGSPSNDSVGEASGLSNAGSPRVSISGSDRDTSRRNTLEPRDPLEF